MPSPITIKTELLTKGFPETGFVREKTLLSPYGPLPIDRSTLWRWVKEGRFPKPVKIGPNTTAWRAEDVRRFLADPLQPIAF